ncbi:hypothetical protein GCM10027591_05720 [Zhihengliuella somnathii]
MCWHIENNRGLVLTDIAYTAPGKQPVDIIDSLAIAQLEVPYDSGERLTSDITDAGFGGTRMKTLTDEECEGRRLSAPVANIGDGTHGESPVREVLCSTEVPAGLAYRSGENGVLTTRQSDQWMIYAVSKVGWYEYLSQYAFTETGSIKPQLGATGDLSPVDYAEDHDHGWAVGEGEADYAASHSHNTVWRVEWGLGGDGSALEVEQYDAEPTGEAGDKSPIIEGSLQRIDSPAVAHKEDRRWWRVLAPGVTNEDGHPISYEIALEKTDSFTAYRDQLHHGDDAGYDVAFTNANECQIYATYNDAGCGRGVLDFVAEGEGEPLKDVVSWVAVGFHHVPRDEDQSPMEMHWQGFTLQPRDLNGQNPLTPDSRSGINGQPDTWQGEDVDELIERYESGFSHQGD